jgi:hypothetical protein
VLRDLKRAADAVRERDALRCRDAEDAEHELSHGVRRAGAVFEELGEARVAPYPLVAAVRLDEPQEGLARQGAGAQRRREAPQQRVDRLAGEGPLEVLFEGGEGRQAVAGELVAQVVGEAGEAVESEQVAAQGAGQEAQGDGEVLARRAAEDVLGANLG